MNALLKTAAVFAALLVPVSVGIAFLLPADRAMAPGVALYSTGLALMAACVLVTLPLEFLLRARVYRRPVRLALAMLPTLVVFVAWDMLGIARDHWSYSPRFTTGIMLGPMPLEELVFFLVIPVCGLLTYEAVGSVLRRVRGGEEDGHA